MQRLQQALANDPYRTADEIEITVEIAAGIANLSDSEEDGDSAVARAARAACGRGSGIVVEIDVVEVDEDSPAVLEPAAEGVVLGGMYRLLHEISSGAIGVVYRAEDLGLRRPVAVKILRPDMANDTMLLERFREEGAILASLKHANIVQVYAAGIDEGRVYFAMELVEGESVLEAIQRCARQETWIPLAKVRAILIQIGSALDTLHEVGVVHRDVKPGNILLDAFRDRAVLVDVGIARRRGMDTEVSGTPGYMAPEIFDTAEHSLASDIYGLAVTAYEMLTFELPWPRSEKPLEMLHLQRENRPLPPSARRPELAPIDEVIMRGIDPDPGKRWSSAVEFATSLALSLATVVEESGRPKASITTVAEPPSAETIIGVDEIVDHREAHTRGFVFRQATRVLGPRRAAAWRLALNHSDARLAESLSPSTPPLAWLPTDLLIALLREEIPGEHDAASFAHELGKAAVRATFRRFFPASGATLTPSGTLGALKIIWERYHSWGDVETIPQDSDSASVRMKGTPHDPNICTWTTGLLEQLVILSGGRDPATVHSSCEARGDKACVFDIAWTLTSYDRVSPLGVVR